MISLENLPVEILMSIADNLVDQSDPMPASDCWTGDLYCLSLISRTFHNIVESHLYSSFQKHGANVTLFLRTLLEQPRLAKLVRKVVIRIDGKQGVGPRLQSDVISDMRTMFSSTQMYHAVEALCLGYEEPEVWLWDILVMNWDAREAFLLSLLPNLKDLSIYVRSGPFPYLEKLLVPGHPAIHSPVNLAGRRRHPLDAVTDFTISTFEVLEVGHVAPFLTLASLKHFRGDYLSTAPHNLTVPHQISAVQCLELYGCQIHENMMGSLLRSFNHLRVFRYEWAWCLDSSIVADWDYGTRIGPCLIDGLASSQATLEELVVRGLLPVRDDAQPFGPMQIFENLKTLAVPSMLMMERIGDGLALVDSVPPSLERLHLTNDCFTDDETLSMELVRMVQQKRLRSLQSMTIAECGGRRLEKFVFRELSVVCQQAKIHLLWT